MASDDGKKKKKFGQDFWTSFNFIVHSNGATVPATRFTHDRFSSKNYYIYKKDIYNNTLFLRADKVRVSNVDEDAANAYMSKFKLKK